MQSVARLVARSARSAAEHYCSRRQLVGTARCGGGGSKEEILKVPQSSAATMAEPVAGDAARSRTASLVLTGIAQGERFFVGYCVVVYGSLLGLVLRRFKGGVRYSDVK